MPFLRAALRKKQEAVQEELLRPPVVVPVEEPEPEPELPEPTTIAELHGIIDRRTEESEFEPETVHDEPEITADTENEILTDEPANVEGESPDALTGESDISTGESVEAVSVESEESETLTGEAETVSSEGETPETLTAESETASGESEAPETLPGESVDEPASIEGETAETLTDESIDEPATVESEESESLVNEPAEPASGEDKTPSSTGGGKFDGSELQYDFTSGERYVDKVSTKTEFDRMLDELAAISKDLLSWEAEKFAKAYTGRFTEGSDTSQSDARKYEAFLGGYITNAAMLLYDKGYREAAIKQLEQAKSILEARKKLEDETSAIKSRVEEQNDTVDLSDILGLFGDG